MTSLKTVQRFLGAKGLLRCCAACLVGLHFAGAALADAQDASATWQAAVGHMRASDPSAALPYLESLVRDHPDSAEYRLELAYALYQLGRDLRAIYHFNQVRGAKLNDAQRAAVNSLQTEIAQRKVWSFRFGLSVEPTTNAGKGTDASTVTIGALNFAIPPSAQSKPATGYFVTAGVTALPRINDRLRASLSFDTVIKHYSARALRETIAVGRSGLRWYGTDEGYVEAGLLHGVSYAAGARYSDRSGVYANYATTVGTRAFMTVGVEHYTENHLSFAAADGTRTLVSGGFNYALNGQALLRFRGYAIRTDTNSPTISGWETSATLGASYAFRGGMVAGVDFTVGRTTRDGVNTLVGVARKDRLFAVETELYNSRFQIGPFLPTLNARFERNKSNITLNDYTVRSLRIGLRASF